MSPSCMIKPKQTVYQPKSKSKSFKNKQKPTMAESMTTAKIKFENDQSIYIELDIKCSCSQSISNHHASIQFSRRYLQCQSSMPIAILRSYIQQILPHSSMTQVSFYDANDRLLQDSHLLRSLKSTSSSSSLHIPIRFTLLNTITSLSHCSCSSSSSSSSSIEQKPSSFSSSPTIIRPETIDQTLSTCSFAQTSSSSSSIYSPCLSSSPPSESSPSISIVNLLTPPPPPPSLPSSSSSSGYASFCIANVMDVNNDHLINDQTIIDEITSQFGEICPPLPKKSRNRVSKKMLSTYASNVPLDLSVKKRSSPSSSYDIFASQLKWIKT